VVLAGDDTLTTNGSGMSQLSVPPDVDLPLGPGVPADERVPYDLAATALGCSRRTVERMVSKGQLERDTIATDAAAVSRVTRRSLVAALADRRANVATTTPAGEAVSGVAPGLDVNRLVADLVEARAEAAGLQERVRLLETGTDEVRRRDELLASLVAGSWRQRRQARRDALAALVADRAAG